MKSIKVKSGKHYPVCRKGIFPVIYLYKKTYEITKRVRFTQKSLFMFLGEDIYDWSKLFGFSFGHHHKNESFRFGFRMLNSEKIEIAYYYYDKGKRTAVKICELDYNKIYRFNMFADFKKRTIKLNVLDQNNKVVYRSYEKINHIRWWGYRLGVYIGGNNPAPHTIKIDIE